MACHHNSGSALIRIFLKILDKERGQEAYKNHINGFSKKIWFVGKWTILGPKLVCPRNTVYALRSFSKFCTMKGAKRHMKITLMVFRKKVLFKANGPFWAQKLCIFITLDLLKWYFLGWEHERGQEVIIRGSSNNVFLLHSTLVYAQVYMPKVLQITRQNFDKIIII